MRTKKIVLPLLLASCFLASCSTSSSSTYTLTFYQPHGNHSDDYTVTIGKTTLDEIKTYANGLKDYSKKGYDRTWDWDHFDFENQKEDWTIEAINPLHNYKISFQYEGVEKGSTTYTFKDSDYTVPEMTPDKKGFVYAEKEHLTIKDKYSDLVSELDLQRCQYKLSFFVSDDDPNPTVVEYNYDSSSVTAPEGPEGYDNTWVTKDGAVSIAGGATVDMKTLVGEDKLNNYSLYLNKVGKKYTVTFDVNGGTMEGETTKEVTFGEACDFPVPTFKNKAKFLGWADSESGTLLENGQPYSVPRNATLYACYGIDFEEAENLDLIVKANPGITRDCIASKALDNTTKTVGSNSAKIISNTASTTFSCSFDSDFVTSAFENPAVKAINFDLKTSAACTKLSYANNVETSYEFDYNKGGDPAVGYGAQTYWKTFSFTREMYTKAQTLKTANIGYIVTVGGQLPHSSTVWIDNVKPVFKELTNWGFENSQMVPYNATPGEWYNRAVSYRNFENKEIFTYIPTSACDSKFGFDYDIKSEGNRSIKAHKNKDKNVAVSVLNCDNGGESEIESVTFDVYVTTELNTKVTFLTGNQQPMSDKNLPANTWTTYTVPKEKMSISKSKDINVYSFIWLCGSPEYDIYFDNIQITLKK